MFERYTEKARRVVFFARYEASQFGSTYIETEHLLLGILREDKALTNRFLRSHASAESIRRQIEKATTIREKISTRVDLRLSNESKLILAYAAEEAERLNNKHIGTEHLFLGILREENSFAAGILNERGIQIDSARAQLVDLPPQPAAPLHAAVGAPTSSLFRDLTQAAQEGALHPLIGRDQEIAAVIQVLSTQGKFPLLVGPHGAGKAAIVHGLAQRIADGAVPPRLAHARIIETEPAEFAKLFAADSNPEPAILFIDLSQRLLALQPRAGSHSLPVFLKWLHANPHLQCIAVADEPEITEALNTNAWLLDLFRAIHVHRLDEKDSLAVLRARKTTLEEHYAVTYSDAAIEAALKAATANPSLGSSLQTGLDLLDAAGATVSLGDVTSPEIAEVRRKIRAIVGRMDNAIMNHEFEKAKFLADEEHKERENLRVLEEKLEPGSPSVLEVTPDDIQQVLIRWSAYPYAP